MCGGLSIFAGSKALDDDDDKSRVNSLKQTRSACISGTPDFWFFWHAMPRHGDHHIYPHLALHGTSRGSSYLSTSGTPCHIMGVISIHIWHSMHVTGVIISIHIWHSMARHGGHHIYPHLALYATSWWSSYLSTSGTPCHVMVVIISIHIPLSRIQPIISDTDIPLCHEAKLFSIVSSLGLPLSLFPSNLPVHMAFPVFQRLVLFDLYLIKEIRQSYGLWPFSINCCQFLNKAIDML
ncbi:hypothetical protein BsWGS_25114 [Bradybaena similaris]